MLRKLLSKKSVGSSFLAVCFPRLVYTCASTVEVPGRAVSEGYVKFEGLTRKAY